MKRIVSTVAVLLVAVLLDPTPIAQGPGAPGQELIAAAFEGDMKRVRQLVSQGLAVDTRDEEQRTALMCAAFNGHTQVAAFLLESGAAVEAKDSNGRTALMYGSSGPFRETVELLLDAGADPDLQGTLEGFTALMTAAAEGQLEVVRLLLTRGADPSLVDEDGDTALSFAMQKGHTKVAELLRDPPGKSE